MISVLVVDDGVNINDEIRELSYDFMITSSLDILSISSKRSSSHGTVCTRIIKKYFKDVKFSSIKILNEKTKKGKKEQLIAALTWSLDKEIDIIHMSLGSIDYRDFSDIRKAVDLVIESGKIIVAACSNKMVFTVPACLPNVISVACDKNLKNDEIKFNEFNCDGIDYLANGSHELQDGYISPSANSCAAPVVTARVCDILINKPKYNTEDIKKELNKRSINFNENLPFPKRREELIKKRNLSRLEYYYHTYAKIKKIEVPILAFFDFDNDNLKKIKQLFNEDGYNCLAVSNGLESNVNNIEYISFLNIANISNNLKALYTVYHPDVILMNIKEMTSLDILSLIEVDVIYLEGGKNGYMKKDDILYFSKYDDITSLYIEIMKAYEENE